MRNQRRKPSTLKPRVEPLDARVVPAAGGFTANAQALAQRLALAGRFGAGPNFSVQNPPFRAFQAFQPFRVALAPRFAARPSFAISQNAAGVAQNLAGGAAAALTSAGSTISGPLSLPNVLGRSRGFGAPPGFTFNRFIPNVAFPVNLSGALTRVFNSRPAVVAPVANASTTATATTSGSVTTQAATGDVTDIQNGPLAKGGQQLIEIFQAFQENGDDSSFHPPQASFIRMDGTNVGVNIRGTGDLADFQSTLTGLGMQVLGTDAATGTVEGMLPIARLIDVAQLSQTVSLSPMFLPRTA